MSNRRRQRGEFYHREVQGPRSQHRKPSDGTWQPTVPLWEKQFCSLVGFIPWQKLLEAKRSMYLYDNVVQWNDSAGEEAFRNAKNRFWAKINGLPCDISMPDPDIYIDEIDWNSNIDQELLLDLEREPEDLHQRNKGEEVVILGSSLLNPSFYCTGWGDAEDDLQKAADKELDPRYENRGQHVSNYENSWESHGTKIYRPLEDTEWRDYSNNSNGWKNSFNKQDVSYDHWKKANCETDGDQGAWDGNSRDRGGAAWYMLRYKASRFHSDDNRGWWRNGRERKRVNFAC